MDDWDDLRFALAVSRNGGLSGAARALSVTHATVARRLERLEARLGRPLFERSRAGLTPTPAGVALSARAETMEAAFHGASLDLEAAAALSTPLTITAPPVMATPLFGAMIAAFRDDRPDISVRVLGDNGLADLSRREADVAFRVTRAPSESLWGRKLVDQRAGWFGVEGLGPGSPRIAFARSTRADGAAGPVLVETDDMVAATGLARAGIGIARLPLVVGAAAPELRLIKELGVSAFSPIWLLTHPDLRRAPRVRAFMAHMAKAFAARRADFLGGEEP